MKKHKILKMVIVILALLLAYGCFVIFYFLNKEVSEKFCENTTINGYQVSGMNVEEAAQVLKEQYSGYQFELVETGEIVLSKTLEQLGYDLNEEELSAKVTKLMLSQKDKLIKSYMKGNAFDMTFPVHIDEKVFKKRIKASKLSVPRVASVDAQLSYDGQSYSITPEVYGNEFTNKDLRAIVKETIEDALSGEMAGNSTITAEIPKEIYYLPAVKQDAPELVNTMNIYNKYAAAKIEYVFGPQVVTLDWNTIKDWIIIDGSNGSISDEKAYEYIINMSLKYDTIYTERSFTASDGRTITLPSNDYGYRIDRDGEFAQMIADINANTVTQREPVYSIKGYARNGRDDLCGTYVEVNLSAQHLWFYKNGALLVESDFVSGLPKDGRETTTGAFPIAYKQSPAVLEGGSGEGAWSEPVDYWMPFHEGQGLHDAPWRSSFGGDIYKTNGSHGCINLPGWAAAAIFESMESRIPILLYK